MEQFLHLSNESRQWKYLQVKNIFLNSHLLIKVEIMLVSGFTYYT